MWFIRKKSEENTEEIMSAIEKQRDEQKVKQLEQKVKQLECEHGEFEFYVEYCLGPVHTKKCKECGKEWHLGRIEYYEEMAEYHYQKHVNAMNIVNALIEQEENNA